jgi:hypothetical protein
LTINITGAVSENNWPVSVESLSEDYQIKLSEIRLKGYKYLVKLQFDLCYHAHISIEDSSQMSHPELMMFYQALVTQKEAEKEAMESSSKKVNNGRRR